MPAYSFSDNCHYVVDGWNGAAADTKRNRLLIWGGGHVAYPGNEVYSLDLSTPSSSTCTGGTCRTNASAPTMTRLNDPSVFSLACPQPTQLADGTPVQRHTYGSLVYLPKADKLFAWAGPDYCAGTAGQQYHNVWLLNLATNKWEMHTPGGFAVSSVAAPPGPDAYCELDPTTTNEAVVCRWAQTILLRYNVDGANADTWQVLSPYGSWSVQTGATDVVDPDHKVIWTIGPDYLGTAGTGKIRSIDLTNPTSATDWTSQTTGCADLMGGPYPGLAWDSTLHKVVGYVPSSASALSTPKNLVIVFDPVAKTCSTQAATGGPQASSSILTGQGTFGRFSYFPALGKYALVNNSSADAYTFTIGSATTSTSGTTTTGDTTAPTITMTAPGAGATVSGSVTVTAAASDNVGVVSVQFTLDGSSLGSAVTAAPYTVSWSTTGATNGTHSLSAIAKDAAGNSATATAISVSVNNTATDTTQAPVTSTGINGLGQSTITCIDKDGDKYGVGPGCLGPDADDNDSSIHTGSDAVAKYGTMTAFLSHLGYSAARIWYIAPAGSNSTGVVNDPAHPFQDWSGVVSKLGAGDVVMLRSGSYSFWATGAQKIGTASSPLVIMSYPGELAKFATYPSGFDLVGASNLVLDGMYFHANGANAGVQAGANTNFTVRHVESSGCEWGMVASDIQNLTVEESVFHDNAGPSGGGQHGIYLANHQSTPSNNVTVRRNLLYNNDYTGFQFNGKVTNLLVEQNVAYNNSLSGFSWLTGVNHSTFRDNVAFNNGQAGLVINNYTDFCLVYDPNAVGTGCPYDQNYNLIENFTVYNTGKDRDGGGNVASQAAILVGNTAQGQPGDLGHNTFRNIVASVPGIGNGYQPIVFLDTNKTYLSTSVFDHILFNLLDMGQGVGSAAIGYGYSSNFGYAGYTCAQAQSITTITNCTNADPQFTSASTSYWNSPASFDLHLKSTSPAAHTGTATGAPTYDIAGVAFGNPPSMGAYEVGTGTTTPVTPPTTIFSKCDLNQDGSVNSTDVQAAVNQVLGTAACGSADLLASGQCNIVDVQRVINASLGGTCVTGQ